MVPVRQCATRALGPLLRRQPLSAAKVRCAWAVAVGAALARATTVRLRSNGTLDVFAESEHWRRETARSTRVIHARLGVLLGPDTVKKVVITKGRHHA